MNIEYSNVTAEEKRSDEVKRFLKKIGARPINLKEWKSGQPVIFVLGDSMVDVHYGKLPYNSQPTLAFLKPNSIDVADNCIGEYVLENKGTDVKYYSIDNEQGKFRLQHTSNKQRPYLANINDLFLVGEEKFYKFIY